jgi:hypothetical protein
MTAIGRVMVTRFSAAAPLVVSVGLTLGGCGMDSRRAMPAHGPVAGAADGVTQDVHGLKGDEDDEDLAGHQVENSVGDNDVDGDNDLTENLGKGYYDEDDGRVRDFGRPGSPREARRFIGIVKRYYAAASTGDGATACSMMKASIAGSMVEDYGAGAGPVYLRGARTCAVVMSRLFGHLHRDIARERVVTGVRVGNGQVFVLLGSRTAVASYVTIEREAAGWRVVGLLAEALP